MLIFVDQIIEINTVIINNNITKCNQSFFYIYSVAYPWWQNSLLKVIPDVEVYTFSYIILIFSRLKSIIIHAFYEQFMYTYYVLDHNNPTIVFLVYKLVLFLNKQNNLKQN